MKLMIITNKKNIFEYEKSGTSGIYPIQEALDSYIEEELRFESALFSVTKSTWDKIKLKFDLTTVDGIKEEINFINSVCKKPNIHGIKHFLINYTRYL